jgi:co-chaperonin GroES (HSP10)
VTTPTNESGIVPVEYQVLVRPADVPKQTKGGLLLPDEHHERVKWAETRGVLVAASPIAFTFEADMPPECVPKPGDEVIFAKHMGVEIQGEDGVSYRLMKDKDVLAVSRRASA